MSMYNRNIPVVNQDYMNQQQAQQSYSKLKKKLLIRRLSVFFVLVAIVCFMLMKTISNQKETLAEMKNELSSLNEQQEELIKEQKFLEEEIIKLQDDEYIGKYARKELFLSDEGEIIFSISEEE